MVAPRGTRAAFAVDSFLTVRQRETVLDSQPTPPAGPRPTTGHPQQPLRPRPLPTLLLLITLGLGATNPNAQTQEAGGDQFLDGIGETALVARYLLDGHTSDRSRNGYHATLHGAGAAFVEDARFGRVLSLPGRNQAHLQIPGEALHGLDTLSVTGWIFLRSPNPWQRFFDFGLNTASNFFCTPIGDGGADGYRARITTQGWTGEQGPTAPSIPIHQWVHLAIVLDPSRHSLRLYRDGTPVGRSTQTTLHLEHVLHREEARLNQLFLGKSRYDSDPTLDANLHDVRLYSIALSDQQVATIARQTLQPQLSPTPAEPAPAQAKTDTPNPRIADPLALARPPALEVETHVGTLPLLPRNVVSQLPDGAPGPLLRIIWPAPTNNLSVLHPGAYSITGRVAGTQLAPIATVTVRPAAPASPPPTRRIEPFPLDRVTLLPDQQQRPTPFMKHRDKFLRTLAQTDPDRFLYMFRNAFGQQQPDHAQPLGGWDSQTTRLRGHATGHYLSAIAQAYASAVDQPALRAHFLQKMNYLVDTLHGLAQKSGRPEREGGPCHADPATVPPGPGRTDYDSDLTSEGIRTDYWNWGHGFLSAYPPDQFIMLERGATYGSGNHQIWAPYYTLHKILAGLLDCYEVGGNPKALATAQGMGLWVQQRLQAVPTPTRISMWNRYIAGEFGGMNDAMARLARLSNDPRFLLCAQLFDNINFFFGAPDRSHGLARNVDTLRGKHANQHIPQITGALHTFRLTQQRPYFDVAHNFWRLCTEGYMYSIGGVAGARHPNNAECFTAEPDSLFTHGFARGGQNETCATYNLLKLSRELFCYDPDARYLDYYERALYNDILASVAPDDAGNTYHIPLNPGARKQFGNALMDGFTCCNGTALETATKLQDSIYFQSADHQTLYVNLFIPSTLRWTERGVTITQHTSFPYEDTTRLTLLGGGSFALRIRLPHWATRGLSLTVNGQPRSIAATPASYLTLQQEWPDPTSIECRIPFPFHLDRLMDQPNIASLFYGPVLLAAQEPGPRSDWRPVTLDPHHLDASIQGNPSTLRFQLGDLLLQPFFESYDRYSVYLDVQTPSR